jgi:tetratricopeptide (TPR) repeat protein
LFREADRLADSGEFSRALETLENLRSNRVERAELLWRKAYVQIYLGKHASNKDKTNVFYEAALADAESAVRADSLNAQAYAVQGMAAGRASLATSSNRHKVELSRQVKESSERAIQLDPQLDIGYHVRGRWHYEIATLGFLTRAVVKVIYGGFPEASVEQSAADLERAIELHDRVTHRLHLGIAYQELGRKREAIEQFERALEMPPDHPDDPEFKQEARTHLRKLR